MVKVHLLWKKEEITAEKMDDAKLAVVFDVLLATSTITACLSYGARHVTPVLDAAEALSEAEKLDEQDVCLIGEEDGITIDGFMDPTPLGLKGKVAGKQVVLSTTNGTVAIRNAAPAKEVYIASLLNGEAVAKRIVETYEDETIVVVCSGSRNQFCIEDFYGAGYFIEQLVGLFKGEDVELTDSALAAQLFHRNLHDQAESVLSQSQVGKMLDKYGFSQDISFVSEKGSLAVVPRLIDGKKIMAETEPVT